LTKLAALYQGSPELAPTKTLRTLKEWSAQHNWQQRVIDRIEEDAAEVRKRLRERAVRFRERVAAAIEVDVTRLLQRLRDASGEIMVESAADLERLVKLYYQLTEQPLSDRSEVTGAGGAPIAIEVLFGSDGSEPEADTD